MNKNGKFNFSTYDNTITTIYDANSRILTVTGSTENIFTLFNVLYINLTNLGAKVIQSGIINAESISPGESEILTITFPRPFTKIPVVVASIGTWFANADDPLYKDDKEYVSVSFATTTQVKVKWSCISQSSSNGRKIKWIAIGE